MAVLSRPDAALWVTAEGAFRDTRQRPVRLQPGLVRLLCRTEANPVVLPLAVEYPFWEERTPEALVRFGEPVDVAACRGLGVAEWQARLAAALECTMDQLAADSIKREPARFETLLGGSAGVGGAYDFWRRLKAFARREPFRAEHGDRP